MLLTVRLSQLDISEAYKAHLKLIHLILERFQSCKTRRPWAFFPKWYESCLKAPNLKKAEQQASDCLLVHLRGAMNHEFKGSSEQKLNLSYLLLRGCIDWPGCRVLPQETRSVGCRIASPVQHMCFQARQTEQFDMPHWQHWDLDTGFRLCRAIAEYELTEGKRDSRMIAVASICLWWLLWSSECKKRKDYPVCGFQSLS